MNRIVITGMGIVSALGSDLETFWNNIKNGKSGVVYKNVMAGNSCEMLCAPIVGFEQYEEERLLYTALYSVNHALNMCKLRNSNSKTGLFIGTASGMMPALENKLKKLFKQKDDEAKRNYVCFPYHGIGQFLDEKLDLNITKCITFTSACASSSYAIQYATMLMKQGILDQAIILGAELLSEYDLTGFKSLGIISQKAIRPFDAQRDGIVLGEGCAAIILEKQEFAVERDVEIFAEVKGNGISNEAYRLATPDPKGLGAKLAMEKAIKDANLSCKDIQYINAHGTGTVLNDAMETNAIKNVFGKYAYHIPISSSKSMIGHTRGASGALEAIICALAIKEQIVPPTINYHSPDQVCDLDYVPNESRKVVLNNVLSNSFGFGGHCAATIFSKFNNKGD